MNQPTMSCEGFQPPHALQIPHVAIQQPPGDFIHQISLVYHCDHDVYVVFQMGYRILISFQSLSKPYCYCWWIDGKNRLWTEQNWMDGYMGRSIFMMVYIDGYLDDSTTGYGIWFWLNQSESSYDMTGMQLTNQINEQSHHCQARI